MTAREAIFLIHLLQDVQVLRPLIFMAAADHGFETRLLVSDRFGARDTSGIWLKELHEICAESGAQLVHFGDDFSAHEQLTGAGLLISASESNTLEHATAHNIFRHAPAGYLKVTVQHGFECIGLRHGAGHSRSYGETGSFAADILCTWFGHEQLTSLAPSQAPKILVTGPTSVLQLGTGAIPFGPRPGLVFENLHSVRFGSSEKLQQEFLGTFRKFANTMHRKGQVTRLRPHPGGRFSTKGETGLPNFVQFENAPLYRLDLRQFAFGISPPSSVLIDMLLADLPTAVWRDRHGRVDLGNYTGLTTVSSSEDMIKFAQEAAERPEAFVTLQRNWLEQQGMPLDATEVYTRLAALFEAVERADFRTARLGEGEC